MPISPTQPDVAILNREWQGLTVEYGRLDSIGEFDFAMPKQGVSVAFAPHDQVIWSVDGGPRQSTSLPAGSVFVYGQREFVWHRRVKPSEYVNLTVDPALLQTIASENSLPAATIEHRVLVQDPTILHVAQLLKAEVVGGGLAGTLYVESLRNLLAVHLLRNYAGEPVKLSVAEGQLDGLNRKKLTDYIEAHLADELAIATLAALIPMSQFYFARAFKAALGEPPHRYISQRRIERAKVLLSVKQLSVAEIAYQVGFANQSHFTAQFRKAVGMTPKQFRDCV